MRDVILTIIMVSVVLTSCCSYKLPVKKNETVKINPTTKYFNKKMKQLRVQIAQN
jgi:hypothetical protein